MPRQRSGSCLAVCQYIDDLLQMCAQDESLAWRASLRIGKVLGFLGLHLDAARKGHEPSQTPGAWSGATVMSDKNNVYQSGVTNERWEKTQCHIQWVAQQHVGLEDELTLRLLTEEDCLVDGNGIGHRKIGALGRGSQ